MTNPRTTPSANVSRQPTSLGKMLVLSARTESRAPAMAPSQKLPLMMRSTRPRYLLGMSSSMAELIAAYSPPMPKPVKKRKTQNHQTVYERAVSAVAIR